MSETTTVGGGEQVNEEVPTPKFTETSRDSATSALDPKEIAKQVAEILRPEFEKTIQSTKDKRIAKLEKAVGLAELEELGATIPDHVKAEYRNRELEQRLAAMEERGGSAPKQTSQGSGAAAVSEWARIVEEVGLEKNSPEYINLLRGEYRNLDHFEAEAYRLKKRLDSKPNPTIETSPILDGKKTSAGQGDKESRLASLQKDPIKNRKEIAELEKDLGW